MSPREFINLVRAALGLDPIPANNTLTTTKAGKRNRGR